MTDQLSLFSEQPTGITECASRVLETARAPRTERDQAIRALIDAIKRTDFPAWNNIIGFNPQSPGQEPTKGWSDIARKLIANPQHYSYVPGWARRGSGAA